ncbi:hypothetical protein FEM03_22305 [Phragmitibacter flavus]|uniref:Gingipain propeptide domain-containing protein n=1 Tax=Phragmitibacter flavus TaxID=2576071 RepID=A0A5R8K8C1_9BACT|nr:hypothetical protein [Phragmitibacter flavus]TLD68540.1 hypothetical protein FEM03_22305 [Phragmitibacter flavus]
MKTTSTAILSLILTAAPLFAAEDVEIYRGSEILADGTKVQIQVSIPPERLSALPKTNLLLEGAPVTAEDAIALSANAFEKQDPLIERTLVQRVELLQAAGPEIDNQNFFIGIPLYVVEIHGFRSERESPHTYMQKFVVLPDKSVEIPIVRK